MNLSVRERYLEYLAREERSKVGDRIAHNILAGFLVLMTLLFVGTLLLAVLMKNASFFKGGIVPVGLILGFVRLKMHKERRTALTDRIMHTIPVWATIIGANQALYKPGPAKEICGAVVLVTFDKTLAEDAPLMMALVGRLFYLQDNPSDQPEIQDTVKAILDERPITREGERIRLPDALIEGVAVYAVSLFIHRQYLKEGFLTPGMQRLPCLIEPDNGGIWHLPHQIVAGANAPEWWQL